MIRNDKIHILSNFKRLKKIHLFNGSFNGYCISYICEFLLRKACHEQLKELSFYVKGKAENRIKCQHYQNIVPILKSSSASITINITFYYTADEYSTSNLTKKCFRLSSESEEADPIKRVKMGRPMIYGNSSVSKIIINDILESTND